MRGLSQDEIFEIMTFLEINLGHLICGFFLENWQNSFWEQRRAAGADGP